MRKKRRQFDWTCDAFGNDIEVGDTIAHIYRPSKHDYVFRKGVVVDLHERLEPEPTEVIVIIPEGEKRKVHIKRTDRVLKV